jgi:hypothetical protein
MAIGIRIKLAGGTVADIDRLNAAIDPAGDPPAGLRSMPRARLMAASG